MFVKCEDEGSTEGMKALKVVIYLHLGLWTEQAVKGRLHHLLDKSQLEIFELA